MYLHIAFHKADLKRVLNAVIIISSIVLLVMIVGCQSDTVQPTPPEDDVINVRVGIVVADFPMAPDTASIFSGADEVVVELRRSQRDTIYAMVALKKDRPQFVTLVDNEYKVYGAALFTGTESELILSSESTSEVPIVAAPYIWSIEPSQVIESLSLIRTHQEYSHMVALVRSSLQTAPMEEVLADSMVAEIGLAIVLDITSHYFNEFNQAELIPGSVGTVTLTTPPEAEDAGIYISGDFNSLGVNLSSVRIRIINILNRRLIPCRLDYPQGASDPLRVYKYPQDLLFPGTPFNPSIEECFIDFDTNNLDKIDLVFYGAGGRGPELEYCPCCAPGDREHLFLNSLLSACSEFAGFTLVFENSFIAWLLEFGISLTSLEEQWKTAVQTNDYDEADNVKKQFLGFFIEQATGNILTQAIQAKQIIGGFTLGGYTSKVSSAPVSVTFTMTAERQSCPPGDCERTLGSWELQWGDRGTSYFSYQAKVAQLLSGDEMGFLFTPDPLGSGTPQAIVFVRDVSQLPLNAPVECQMDIFFGTGSSNEVHSPTDYKSDDGVPPAQTYVTFLQLDLPEGLFPGLASGYFSGNLQVLHKPDPMDSETWWAENVVIIDASFDSVRVYAEPGYNSFGASSSSPLMLQTGRLHSLP